MIEYVTASWNAYTGCLHSQAECPTAASCWAKDLSHRFKQVCGGDFLPRFHPERSEAPLHWRKPRRVAVCFMGDLGGAWEDAEDSVYPGLRIPMYDIRQDIISITRRSPQHFFLFLTKAPEWYRVFNPWPDNAWRGVTITGAEPLERQQEMMEALNRAEGGHRWVSYEPMLGPLTFDAFSVEWLVMGRQSGPGARRPAWEWLDSVQERAKRWRVPLWEKKNLNQTGLLGRPLRQELPGGMVR